MRLTLVIIVISWCLSGTEITEHIRTLSYPLSVVRCVNVSRVISAAGGIALKCLTVHATLTSSQTNVAVNAVMSLPVYGITLLTLWDLSGARLRVRCVDVREAGLYVMM